MPNRKISELTAASALDGSETVPIVQGGTTKRSTVADIAQSGTIVLTVDPTGSGTNVYSTITAALAAVPVAGAEVVVKRGTYNESALSVPAKTTLRGEDEGTVIYLPNASNVNVVNVAGDDVTIRNLTIDGNRAGQSGNSNCVYTVSARTRVLDCHVKNANGYNIVGFPGATDMLVRGCTTESPRDECIEYQGVVRGVIANNIVRNAGKNGIYVWANTAGAGVCTDITVIGNMVYNSAALTASYAGIRVDDGAKHVTVSGNTVSGGGTTSPAINIASSTAARVSHVSVVGNTINAPTSYGIHVAIADYVTVSANTIRATAANEGIILASTTTNCQAVGNIVTGCASSGITVVGTKSLVANNTSEGNTGRGIYVSGAADCDVVGNNVSGNALGGIVLDTVTGLCAVTGNKATSNGGTTNYGIQVTGCTKPVLISGNTVNLSGAAGILVSTCQAGGAITGNVLEANRGAGIWAFDSSNLTITGNTCRNNGTNGGPGASTARGILIYRNSTTTAYHIVSGNRCFDDQGTKTQAYGIGVFSTADNVILGPNQLNGNATGAESIDGTATNVTHVTPV